jgi:beta-1,2-mannobiose phosphorylase / 1,2-beta-oligomannan phosphorylase
MRTQQRLPSGVLLRLCAGVLLVTARSQAEDKPNDKPQGNAFPPELVDFVPYSGNPLFAGTGKDTWDRKIRERGFIFREDGIYHLYYTGYNESKSDMRFLGYATSPDGLRWTRWPGNPLLRSSWCEDVGVVKRDGTYFMFSEGRDDIAHWLTSKDRLHWQEQGDLDIRYTSGKPLTPGPRGTPAVWIEGNTWYLFYERMDRGIWLAKSGDAKIWTNVQDEPVLRCGPDAYDRRALALNQILRYQGRYYAYYHSTAVETPKNWCTDVATSTDLIHWTKYAKNPIVTGDKSSGILVHDGKQYRLYTMHPDVRVYFHRGAKELEMQK